MTFQVFPPAHTFEPFEAEPALPLSMPHISLGVHLCADGVDVAVMSAHASAVDICFFEGNRTLAEYGEHVTAEPQPLRERRFRLKPGLFGVWSGHIPGIQPGAAYGFRAYGTWDPSRGYFYNPAKVMLDPYATALAQPPLLHSSLYAHKVDDHFHAYPEMEIDNQDSAPYAALGMVISPPQEAEHIHIPWNETVIYEAHVVGLTKLLPTIPEHLRGTYAGVAHPATIAHLKGLGITSLELLPIHAKMAEPFLLMKGLENYWGYNTLNFFIPEPSYATRAAQKSGAEAVLEEVRTMVSALHDAGIEVILDVVYNHTNEAGTTGPSTSFRGLDHLGYYRYNSSNPGELKDTTGCGNSFDFRRTAPINLTISSLRYWVKRIGIDGFRFDLSATLGREGDSFNQHHPLFTAILTDPLLKNMKMINEPWDLGMNGWQTGNFPNGTADWNDYFRDTVRSFWVADLGELNAGKHGSDLRELATRISGSQDIFTHGRTIDGRGVFASINFVTAHDGFSAWDLVSYNSKHNEANLENNQDGSNSNHSWNHGVEGFDDLKHESDAGSKILASRRQTVRNLFGMLLLSAGTPMLRSGDEMLKSQGGNNNAYCQNNEINWLNWDLSEEENNLLEIVSDLIRLRREHPVLRPQRFYRGVRVGSDTLNDVQWFNAKGTLMPEHEWFDPSVRAIQLLRSGQAYAWNDANDKDALIVINGQLSNERMLLPEGRGNDYELAWSSAWESLAERVDVTLPPATEFEAPALSISLFFSHA